MLFSQGLINALESIFPNAEHRFCVMHLYRNMWKDHKGIGVRMCLWLAARATTDYTFNKHMEELKKVYFSALFNFVEVCLKYKSSFASMLILWHFFNSCQRNVMIG